MSEHHTGRRLAAILAADVVGYSRMMGEDESGTLAALKHHRETLFNPAVHAHNGRVFKLVGDGTLVEFASVVDAVKCALAIQRSAKTTTQPNTNRIVLRIGINLGDVMVEGEDVYGDGVNVAVRLEGLAEPGGICVASIVNESVGGRIDVAFSDGGQVTAKNIGRPIRVWRWHPGGDPTGHRPPQRVGEPALSLREQPWIAVLPFSNLSGDTGQDYFADGLVQDIVAALSRFRNLRVVAANSSVRYRGTDLDLRQVGLELGVGYLLEGSVRKSAGRVRITVELVEVVTGARHWASQYERELEDVLLVQDETARAIASIFGRVTEVLETEKACRLSPEALMAYDHVHRARAFLTRAGREGVMSAGQELVSAIRLDSANAEAHAALANIRFLQWEFWWVKDRDSALLEAFELATKAVSLDERNSQCRWVAGMIHIARGEFDQARLQMEKALALNPNDARARMIYGWYLTAVGEPERAIEQIDLARRYNPLEEYWMPWIRGLACYTAERYDDAVAAFSEINEPWNEIRAWLAASLAQVGRSAEAQAMLATYFDVARHDMVAHPGARRADWMAVWEGATQYKGRSDFDRFMDGLRKAGLTKWLS